MIADGGLGVRDLLEGWGTQNMHYFTSCSLESQSGRTINTKNMGELINRWDVYKDDMNKFVQQYDEIICPISAQPANIHGDTYTNQEYPGFAEMFSYLMAYNLLGWPCGTVRTSSSQEGLPVGVRVVDKPWQEDVVLSILSHLESSGGWEIPKL